MAGSKDLVHQYQASLNQSKYSKQTRLHNALQMSTLRKDLVKYATSVDELDKAGALYNAKKELYRFLSLMIGAIAQWNGMWTGNSWQKLVALQQAGVVTMKARHNLSHALCISNFIRLSTYLANDGQREDLSAVSLHRSKSTDTTTLQRVFQLKHTGALFRYYYTVLPFETALRNWAIELLRRVRDMKTEKGDNPVKSGQIQLARRPFYDDNLICQGNIHRRLLQYQKALQCLRAAYQDQSEDLGLLMALFGVSKSLGQFQAALVYAKKAQDIARKQNGNKPHPDIADTLNNLGTVCSDVGKFTQARTYHTQSLAMNRILYKNQPHLLIADSLNNLGIVCARLGEFTQAIAYHTKALDMRRILHKNQPHPDIAGSLYNLGTVFSRVGDLTQAKAYLIQAFSMRRILYGNQPHPGIANSLNSLGDVCDSLGEFSQAKAYNIQALAMMRVLYKNQPHPSIASSLNNLGSIFRHLGEFTQAKTYYTQAFSMRSILYKHKRHPDIAASLNNLGVVCGDIGEVTQAKTYHTQALAMNRLLYKNKPHPHIADSLNNLGLDCKKLGELTQAKAYYTEALAMKRSLFKNKSHPSLALTLYNVGLLHKRQRHYLQALKCFQESFSIYSRCLGPKHLRTKQVWLRIGDVASIIPDWRHQLAAEKARIVTEEHKLKLQEEQHHANVVWALAKEVLSGVIVSSSVATGDTGTTSDALRPLRVVEEYVRAVPKEMDMQKRAKLYEKQ